MWLILIFLCGFAFKLMCVGKWRECGSPFISLITTTEQNPEKQGNWYPDNPGAGSNVRGVRGVEQVLDAASADTCVLALKCQPQLKEQCSILCWFGNWILATSFDSPVFTSLERLTKIVAEMSGGCKNSSRILFFNINSYQWSLRTKGDATMRNCIYILQCVSGT